jgi:MurNAc alpha-1-phosphate uridylyltransferase
MLCDTAVILAAGLGLRMRPLTLTTPKPLLLLEGRPILLHSIARLQAAGVQRIIVNAHHLSAQIFAAVAKIPGVTVRFEPELLDTGGALAAMLAEGLLAGAKSFFVVNGDIFWVDGPGDTLLRLAAAFDPAAMDGILLLARTACVIAQTGQGDFLWPRDGALQRRGERDVAPYVYAGVQITNAAFFMAAPPPPFSMNLLWDRALAAGRLGAIVHDGLWFHLSAPEDLARASAVLEARQVGNTT